MDKDNQRFVVGFKDGSIESYAVNHKSPQPVRLIDQKVSSAVTHLRSGPNDALIVGYANGRVRMLNQTTGRLLSDEKLHGSIRF